MSFWDLKMEKGSPKNHQCSKLSAHYHIKFTALLKFKFQARCHHKSMPVNNNNSDVPIYNSVPRDEDITPG
jgi:hypothetical protein